MMGSLLKTSFLRRFCFAAAVALLAHAICPHSARAKKDDVVFAWKAPESGSILLIPSGGYSEGTEIKGTTLSMRALFAFDYFMVGLHGQSIFADTGVLYTMAVDVNLRYGPFSVGATVSGHWFPSDSSTPKAGTGAHVGICFPTPFDDIFAELFYRPTFVLMESRQLVYHQVMLGLVFETGN